EFAMCITARHWSNRLEWSIHALEAEKVGISARALELLAKNETPAPMKPDEEAVHRFCTELHRNHAVSDATYPKGLAGLGNAGVVELTALCGYYALLAMVMNVAQTPAPPGSNVPFSPMTEIISRDNKLFKQWTSLQTSKGVARHGLALVSGRKIVPE